MKPNKAAVAIKYELEENKAPEILAVGEGWLAEKIVEIAQANDVPVKEDAELTSSLATLECGGEIPRELYELVAECLWFVHRLDEKWQEKVLRKNGGAR